jgi:hypothetical protein
MPGTRTHFMTHEKNQILISNETITAAKCLMCIPQAIGRREQSLGKSYNKQQLITTGGQFQCFRGQMGDTFTRLILKRLTLVNKTFMNA